ncbi:MAG: hypothetical protein QXL10_02530 [Candidatus Bathyarchaeia archaeon]
MQNDPLKFLYYNPESGVYTGFWACSRPRGQYTGIWPYGLLQRVFRLIGQSDSILEPFGGTSKLGVSVDLNPHVRPHIIADAQFLPIRDESFGLVLVDPPYNQLYVEHYSSLHQNVPRTKPKLSVYRALREAVRVCRKGGYIVLLHFLIPVNVNPNCLRRVATIGVGTGPNKRIRCLTIFQKLGEVNAA